MRLVRYVVGVYLNITNRMMILRAVMNANQQTPRDFGVIAHHQRLFNKEAPMFEFENIQDFICKTLIGKVLVKVGDVELHEKIVNAWHDPSTNSIVVYSDKSQTFIYNSTFVLVNTLLEIDWESYSKREDPKFGFNSPYVFGLTENEDYADVFTTEEFYEMVQCGAFIDSDGSGYPSNGTHHLYAGVGVRDLAACLYSKTVTHIAWYNK